MVFGVLLGWFWAGAVYAEIRWELILIGKDIDHNRGGVRIWFGLWGGYDACLRQYVGLNRLDRLTRPRSSGHFSQG